MSKVIDSDKTKAVHTRGMAEAVRNIKRVKDLATSIRKHQNEMAADVEELERITNTGKSDTAELFPPPSSTPTEALFAFMAWLTCRDEAVTFSAKHDASVAVHLIELFRVSQHWPECRGDYTDYLWSYPAENYDTYVSIDGVHYPCDTITEIEVAKSAMTRANMGMLNICRRADGTDTDKCLHCTEALVRKDKEING